MEPLKASQVKGSYSPTKKDLTDVRKRGGLFKLSGDGVFHTLQGEGDTLGAPATFIRLHYCNLSCSWCDTWYTWHKGTKEYYTEPFDLSIDQLAEAIKSAQLEKNVKAHVYKVVFTGGEPLIQQNEIEKFLSKYAEYICEIETNGTIMPSKFFFKLAKEGRLKFNCSPKMSNSENPANSLNLKVVEALATLPNTIFKFVCSSNEDIDGILEAFSKTLTKDQIIIMPEGVTKEENAEVYDRIVDKIISEGLRTTPRLQNICFGGSKRAV